MPGDVLSGEWPLRVDATENGAVYFTRLSESYYPIKSSLTLEKWRKNTQCRSVVTVSCNSVEPRDPAKEQG